MNILFLLRGTAIGGLEVVTAILANKFADEGHKVGVFIFRKDDKGHPITERLNNKVTIYQYDSYSDSQDTVMALREVVIKMNAHIIINQWALPLIPIKTTKRAIKKLSNIKIISVYHNAPDANGRIQSMNIKLVQTENPVKRLAFKAIRSVFTFVTSRAMRYNYEKSDGFLVLSESYRKVFQKFTHVKDTSKLGVMTNPITIPRQKLGSIEDRISSVNGKKKEIIFVGRLDFVQKRTYRVIDVWNLLENKYKDWHLTIVGEGPDRENLENHAKALNLKRVSFEGFKDPVLYYKRASILMLTSDFEGFPLVLAESMSFGVVPVVYDSFAAIRDIIDNGKDGVITEKVNGQFNAEAMAKDVEKVINNCDSVKSMAYAAIEKIKNYSLNEIYKRWIVLLNSLTTDKNYKNEQR